MHGVQNGKGGPKWPELCMKTVIRLCTGISQNHHPCLLTLPFIANVCRGGAKIIVTPLPLYLLIYKSTSLLLYINSDKSATCFLRRKILACQSTAVQVTFSCNVYKWFFIVIFSELLKALRSLYECSSNVGLCLENNNVRTTKDTRPNSRNSEQSGQTEGDKCNKSRRAQVKGVWGPDKQS